VSGSLALAFGAGLLSTVNPCGIAMLPGFMSLYTGRTGPELGARLARGLVVGLAVASGFVAVYAGIGGLLAIGLRPILRAMPMVAVGIGAVLVVVGLALLAGWQLTPRLAVRAGAPSGRGLRAAAAYGAAYALASLSCTAAILLALIAQASATAGGAGLVGVFVAYTAGAALLLAALAVSAALASGALAAALRRLSRHVDRVSGGLLVLVGGYLVAYWLPALSGGRPSGVLADAVAWPSGQITTLFAEHTAAVVVGAALLLAAAVAAAVRRRQTRSVAIAASTELDTSGEAGNGR